MMKGLLCGMLVLFTLRMGVPVQRLSAGLSGSPRARGKVVGGEAFTTSGRVFNIKTFGAQGDGSNDDTAAIKAAISAAQSSGCGVVFFPATDSHYLISSTIVISSCVRLLGATANSVYASPSVWTTSRSADMLDFNQGSQGSVVSGLTFRAIGTPTAGAGIRVDLPISLDGTGQSEFTISDCFFSNLWNGLVFIKANAVIISHLSASANRNDNLLIEGGLNYWLSDSDLIGAARANIETTGGAAFWITDVQTFEGPHGILVDPAAGSGVGQLFAKGFIADATSSDAIAFPPSGGAVQKIEFVDSWATSHFSVGSGGGYGVNLANPDLDGFNWIGGWVCGSYLSGVNLAAGINIQFHSGTNFSGNGLGNATGQSGIQIASGVSQFMIEGCLFGNLGGSTGNQTTGILIAAGPSNNFIITGNMRVTGTARLIVDNSTGGNKIEANNL